LTHDEIEKIVNRVVDSQLFDSMFDVEKEELANEAWIGILEAMSKGEELNEALCYFIAKVSILHFKYWRRFPVSIPKESAHRYVKICADSMKPAKEGDIDKVMVGSSEREVDFNLLLEKFGSQLSEDDKIVLDLLLSGYSTTEVWKMLEEKGIKNAKRVAFNFKKNKVIWDTLVSDKVK